MIYRYRISRIKYIYPITYAHGVVVLCFPVVISSARDDSGDILTNLVQFLQWQWAIFILPQCQLNDPVHVGKTYRYPAGTKYNGA